ncbi:MAG: helix-turn-helix transcriptional regulator [Acetatifactor sp.]|nr:helix-turn-helix transcriptional regulator [Acetatifactor sp.]
MNLGKKIKQLRFQYSYTQEQLAEKMGVTSQAVSKWENNAAMPDVMLLPALAETFGVTIDDLFDLTAGQKMNRIENRMDTEEELAPDVFYDYENYLMEQIKVPENKGRATSLLAHLYHHRLVSYAAKTSAYARDAIMNAPEQKDCQWLLQKAEGGTIWDWNVANHRKTIDFYKSVIANDNIEPHTPLPYYYLLDELIADHRTQEARTYLEALQKCPAHKPVLIPVYEAAIALAEFDEPKANAIMEKALADHAGNADVLFEAAQFYAHKCDYDKAIQYYEASFESEANRKPRYTDALEGIAAIHEIRGDYAKAAETHKHILTLLHEEWGFKDETSVLHTEQEIARLQGMIK